MHIVKYFDQSKFQASKIKLLNFKMKIYLSPFSDGYYHNFFYVQVNFKLLIRIYFTFIRLRAHQHQLQVIVVWFLQVSHQLTAYNM